VVEFVLMGTPMIRTTVKQTAMKQIKKPKFTDLFSCASLCCHLNCHCGRAGVQQTGEFSIRRLKDRPA
jgi:hypothetical protein